MTFVFSPSFILFQIFLCFSLHMAAGLPNSSCGCSRREGGAAGACPNHTRWCTKNRLILPPHPPFPALLFLFLVFLLALPSGTPYPLCRAEADAGGEKKIWELIPVLLGSRSRSRLLLPFLPPKPRLLQEKCFFWCVGNTCVGKRRQALGSARNEGDDPPSH